MVCRLLNTGAVDARFRRMSGTVSVSTRALRDLPLPAAGDVEQFFGERERSDDEAVIAAYAASNHSRTSRRRYEGHQDAEAAEASMNRRPQGIRESRPQGIKEIREARERSDAERRRLLEHYKGHQAAADRERHLREAALAAKRSRFTALNVGEALAAARRLTFVDLEAEGERVALPLNRPTLAMLELYLRALRERASVAALQWPRGSRDMSILHPLAMLAMIGSSLERTSAGFKWCPAVADCRTLYYPWRGSGNGTTQRRILVDRNEIIKRNAAHLTRSRVGETELRRSLACSTLRSATSIG